MRIVRSAGKKFWHVMFNNIVIAGFYTRKEAQAWLEENKQLEAMASSL